MTSASVREPRTVEKTIGFRRFPARAGSGADELDLVRSGLDDKVRLTALGHDQFKLGWLTLRARPNEVVTVRVEMS